MANFEDANVVRALASGEISKMTNPQLKKALSTLISADNQAQASNDVLLQEIRSIKEELKNMANIKKEVDQLSQKLDDAYKIIGQQQLFLEKLDNRERQRNIVITGLPEENDAIGNSDAEKVRKVMDAMGYQLTSDPETWEIRRLGKPDDNNKKRPVLIVVDNGYQRNEILKKAKNLKSATGPFSTVYVRKDVHPAIRKETARLKTREREEKEKPENVGVEIRYDWKRRVLLRDGNVIDKFTPYFF